MNFNSIMLMIMVVAIAVATAAAGVVEKREFIAYEIPV